MFKRILLAILIAFPVMAMAQAKFGVVNSADLITSMPEMKEVQSQLEAASKKYESEYNNLNSEFQKMYTDLQSLDESTPQTIRDRRLQEIQEKSQKIDEFRQTAEADLQRMQQSLMAPIQQKVIDALNAVGQEGGFTFIFENTAPVYTGADAIDVTSMVKAKLGL